VCIEGVPCALLCAHLKGPAPQHPLALWKSQTCHPINSTDADMVNPPFCPTSDLVACCAKNGLIGWPAHPPALGGALAARSLGGGGSRNLLPSSNLQTQVATTTVRSKKYAKNGIESESTRLDGNKPISKFACCLNLHRLLEAAVWPEACRRIVPAA
jgi:hypothetical protein